MSADELFLNLNKSVWGVVEIMVLFALLVFLGFSILVVRQTQLMTRTVTGKIDKQIQTVSWLFFFVTAVSFLGAVIFL